MNNHVANYKNNQMPAITDRVLGGEEVQTVNSRELHKFLGVQTQLKDWIARRIEEYSFEDRKDFSSFLSESSGGRPPKEYATSQVRITPRGLIRLAEKIAGYGNDSSHQMVRGH